MTVSLVSNASRCTELFQLAGRWAGAMPASGLIAEEKIDGWRAGHWCGLDSVARLWTRNGYEIHGTSHIVKRLAMMERIAGERLFFDGEFQVDGTLAATKLWAESGWKAGGNAGILFLFDAMPESGWKAGGCDTPLFERKQWLKSLHDALEDEIASDWAWEEGLRGKTHSAPPTVVISDDWAMSVAGVQMMAQSVWARGGEGLMMKDPAAAYIRGRSNAWMKLKEGN